MTQICVENYGSHTDITIMGHCNAGRVNGFDLCCCAVSMLTFTLMASLSKLGLDNFHSDYKGGWCHIRYKNHSKKSSEAEIIVNTIMNGFELLKKRFPSCIVMLPASKQKGDDLNE